MLLKDECPEEKRNFYVAKEAEEDRPPYPSIGLYTSLERPKALTW